MSVTKQQIQTVSKWLNDLADLTAGKQPLADAKTKIAAMAPALAEEFDVSTFNRNSLIFAARQCNFFPSFSEACDALAAWRKEHPRPTPLAITGAQSATAEHDERQRQDAESWRGISAGEVRAKIQRLDGHPMRLLWGRVLAIAIKRHAFQHLGLLPPEFLEEHPESAQVVALRRPPPERPGAVLTPEQLTAAWERTGHQRAAAATIRPETKRGPPHDQPVFSTDAI